MFPALKGGRQGEPSITPAGRQQQTIPPAKAEVAMSAHAAGQKRRESLIDSVPLHSEKSFGSDRCFGTEFVATRFKEGRLQWQQGVYMSVYTESMFWECRMT